MRGQYFPHSAQCSPDDSQDGLDFAFFHLKLNTSPSAFKPNSWHRHSTHFQSSKRHPPPTLASRRLSGHNGGGCVHSFSGLRTSLAAWRSLEFSCKVLIVYFTKTSCSRTYWFSPNPTSLTIISKWETGDWKPPGRNPDVFFQLSEADSAPGTFWCQVTKADKSGGAKLQETYSYKVLSLFSQPATYGNVLVRVYMIEHSCQPQDPEWQFKGWPWELQLCLRKDFLWLNFFEAENRLFPLHKNLRCRCLPTQAGEWRVCLSGALLLSECHFHCSWPPSPFKIFLKIKKRSC